MAKFSASRARPNVSHMVTTTTQRTSTYEGGSGFIRDAKSELFLLAVTNFVREQTFYESADARDNRFEQLIKTITNEDPGWMRRFIPWLRGKANMRSASLVAAAEYVRAGGENGRQVVSGALLRADEPGEMLAYWMQRHGRRIPKPVKRGVADAVQRLYTERNVLKYDGQAKAWRFADVIDLVHPTPVGGWQSGLFKYLLDKRHGREDLNIEKLSTILADQQLLAMPADQRRSELGGDRLAVAGWSWERLSGWLPGGMDAEAWEQVIPTMGVFALLRNLRNFDQAGISKEAVAKIQAKLTNAEDIVKARVFPMRFLSAYKAVESEHWKPALDEAVNLSMQNVPALKGRTLILVDVSGSMVTPMSDKSQLERWEAAGVFAAALATRAESAELYAYSSLHSGGTFWAQNGVLYLPANNDRKEQIDFGRGTSVFTVLRRIRESRCFNRGTETWETLQETFRGHDRVVILTDEQTRGVAPAIKDVPLIYTFNLAGYAPAHASSGDRGRYTFGGLSDQAFSALPMLEQFRDGGWPF